MTLRVTLNSLRNELGSKVVTLHVKVPNGRVGNHGELLVGQWGSAGGASSFDGLLTKLANAPRNDQLRGQIEIYAARTLRNSTTTLVPDVIQGSRSFPFRISS